jgi:predicted CopG family antitoxin
MKQAVNFRLDEITIDLVDELSKDLNTTKTNIVQMAVKFFSKKKRKHINPLAEYFGVLEDIDTEGMIKGIRSSRANKSLNNTKI